MATLYVLALALAILATVGLIAALVRGDGKFAFFGLLLFIVGFIMCLVQLRHDKRVAEDKCESACMPYDVFACHSDLVVCRTGDMKADVRKLK